MDKIKGTEGQTIQWTKEKGRKDKQYNGQNKGDGRTNNTMDKIKGTEGQTIQWTKEKGRKDKQYHGQNKEDGRTNHYTEN
jgi:uncharacterized protein Veg